MGEPMAKGKQKFCDKWFNTALSAGFLTIVLAASALAQDSEYIYWVEIGTSTIRRADLDGTNPVNLITGVNDGQGIALQIASSTTSGTQNIRYVPIKSEYVLLVLIAVLGGWFVLRKR